MSVGFPRDTVASTPSLGGGGGSGGGEPAAVVDSASGKDAIPRFTSLISGTMKAIDTYGRRERLSSNNTRVTSAAVTANRAAARLPRAAAPPRPP